ncbi:hypothetical protein TIFTF001_001795 [Ficus carica]|uniref:Uncharacterized protein n=1 Tax=Ficus carica TaxID=3494 RepID=A0AA88CSF8_FICCA|nr:hypothetical protein TIFTF001_001795 [Ficus carica]
MPFPSPTPLSPTTTTKSSKPGFFYDHTNGAIRWASTTNLVGICRETRLWPEKSSATMTGKGSGSQFPREIALDLRLHYRNLGFWCRCGRDQRANVVAHRHRCRHNRDSAGATQRRLTGLRRCIWAERHRICGI